MYRARQLRQFSLRSILRRQRDLMARTDVGAVYIGLGDQFDDDRRRVRDTASALRPVMYPTWAAAAGPAICALRR
jgi:hypothetical protein